MSSLDGNAWYQISESRVNLTSSLQLTGTSLFFAGASSNGPEYWQIFDIGNNQFAIRNQISGVSKQLGTCYAPKELDASKTQPCMLDSDGSDVQKWTVSDWGDGTFKIQNVGNGTNYNLDCHPGNPLFLSSITAETPKQPAQHWMFSSLKAINDGAFSTTFTSQPSSTNTGSTGSTSSATDGATSPTSSSSSHSGLSSGAEIGIGVGVGLGVLILACLGVVFFLKRRRQQRARTSEMDATALKPPGYEIAPSEPKKNQHELFSPPAELPGTDPEAVGPFEMHAPYKIPHQDQRAV